jgi:hypothetical protein
VAKVGFGWFFATLFLIMEKEEFCKEPKELRCEGEGILSKEMLGCEKVKKKKKVNKK